MPILENERHELFCQKLAEGKSASEAYVLAGFKPSRHNASRLRTKENINARVAELQCNAARGCEVSIQSLMKELDDAIDVARAKGQAQAMVSAAGMKAKLSGLMIEKQELRVSDGDFDDSMSVADILATVVERAGVKAAIALAEAFQLDPASYSLDGKPVVSTPVVSTKPVVSTPKLGHSQFAAEQPKPNGRPKREL